MNTLSVGEHGHGHGDGHGHGHGHGAAVNENRRTSQAQKFSQERAGRKSFDNWDQHVDEGESKTNGNDPFRIRKKKKCHVLYDV